MGTIQEALRLADEVGARLDALDETRENLQLSDQVLVYERLTSLATALSLVANTYRDGIAAAMRKNGVKNAQVTDPYGNAWAVELTNRANRVDVNRDDLVRDVERLANDPNQRTNPVTGEMASVEDTRIRLLKAAFRFEPRWAELSKFGLNDDEYCRKEWSASVKVAKAVSL